jgi:dienelactone hydrolase
MARHFVPLAISVRPAVARRNIFGYIRGLRESPPAPFTAKDLKIGTAGFCWGGKYAVELCHDPEDQRVCRGEGDARPLIDCSFTGHPSFLTMPSDIEKVKLPLSVANGDDDAMLPKPKMDNLISILKQKGDAFEVVVYPGATHGFSVRGDPRDPKQAEMGLKAEDQAVHWFQKHFA